MEKFARWLLISGLCGFAMVLYETVVLCLTRAELRAISRQTTEVQTQLNRQVEFLERIDHKNHPRRWYDLEQQFRSHTRRSALGELANSPDDEIGIASTRRNEVGPRPD